MNKKISLVYMVAWMSSRFGGKIKQFAKVWPNDTTLIEYSMHQALKSDFSKIIFIVGKMTETPFKQKFGNSYQSIPVEYALQTFDETHRDRPRGTVDAICSAKNLIDWPFIVCNWDDIYWSNSFQILFNHLQNHDNSASIWYILEDVIPQKGSTNRWIFKVNQSNYVQEINEILWIQKDSLDKIWLNPKDLCSMNIFGLQKNDLDNLNQILLNFKQNHQQDRVVECYLPVELSNLIKSSIIQIQLYPTSDQRLWITNPDDEGIVKKQIQNIEQSQ